MKKKPKKSKNLKVFILNTTVKLTLRKTNKGATIRRKEKKMFFLV